MNKHSPAADEVREFKDECGWSRSQMRPTSLDVPAVAQHPKIPAAVF